MYENLFFNWLRCLYQVLGGMGIDGGGLYNMGRVCKVLGRVIVVCFVFERIAGGRGCDEWVSILSYRS